MRHSRLNNAGPFIGDNSIQSNQSPRRQCSAAKAKLIYLHPLLSKKRSILSGTHQGDDSVFISRVASYQTVEKKGLVGRFKAIPTINKTGTITAVGSQKTPILRANKYEPTPKPARSIPELIQSIATFALTPS
jgi:hypothetical protein